MDSLMIPPEVPSEVAVLGGRTKVSVLVFGFFLDLAHLMHRAVRLARIEM